MRTLSLLIAFAVLSSAAAAEPAAEPAADETVDPSGTIAYALVTLKRDGRTLFRHLDRDRNRQLDRAELGAFLHAYADGVFTAHDSDGSDMLSLDELRLGARDRRVHLGLEPIPRTTPRGAASPLGGNGPTFAITTLDQAATSTHRSASSARVPTYTSAVSW